MSEEIYYNFTIQANILCLLVRNIIQGKNSNYDFDAQAHSMLLLVRASIIIREAIHTVHNHTNNRNEMMLQGSACNF